MIRTRARVDELIRADLGLPSDFPLTPTTEFNGEGPDSVPIDSLDVVELCMTFEDEWHDLDLQDDVVESWRTVGDLYRTLGVEP